MLVPIEGSVRVWPAHIVVRERPIARDSGDIVRDRDSERERGGREGLVL